ncbi:hypothetical protein IDH44_16910 [Paenibacillus sp. IB182496]|uniref:Uncharacterized protein n=1 Tax=Paenibacillus sabuli TaxID=2772509 RepID=A0A927BWS2_9BACL|nr:hypothetical protein [Paenibacillus sabuli]MBD2846879.1 hypothetical protein [Paenibacillus sabuli]
MIQPNELSLENDMKMPFSQEKEGGHVRITIGIVNFRAQTYHSDGNPQQRVAIRASSVDQIAI